MKSFIIYSKVDVEKNKIFINMLMDELAKYNISSELKILEEMSDMSDIGKPDFVINRSRNYKIAQRYEKEGIKVFNDSKLTRLANNKAWMHEYLKEVVPFMPYRYKRRIVGDWEVDYPYVLKSCGGHGGSQVFMITDEDKRNRALAEINTEEFIEQKVACNKGRDVRVYILGNNIRAAVLRTSTESFKSNYSLGGNVELYELNSEEKQMVNDILKVLYIDYGGIDFIFNDGKAVFNEIEDAVGARMLYEVSDIDIIKEYVQYISNRVLYR